MPWEYLPSLMRRRNKIFHDHNEIMKKLMSTSLTWVNCFPLIKNVRDKHAKISKYALGIYWRKRGQRKRHSKDI